MTKKVLLPLLCLLATAVQAQSWWGYWNTGMPLANTSATVSGTTNCAIRITPENALLVDGRLHGVRFWLEDKTKVSEASIWVSFRQFADGATPDMGSKTIAVADLRDMAHDGAPTEVLFDEPVDILPSSNRYANAYVGYTIKADAAIHLLTAGNETHIGTNTCFVNWQNLEASNGPLALQLLVDGPRIGNNSVAVGDFEEQILLAGSTAEINLNVVNEGLSTVSSIDCEVSLDGELLTTGRYPVPQPVDELGMAFTVPLSFEMPVDPKRRQCSISVTKVNGEPNENAIAQGSGSLIALSQWPQKRSVMEELTGTWCPNCPRGLVGMRLLEETFGDRFIGIAIHGGSSSEPMRLADYDGSEYVRGLSARMGGRPSCAIDRWAECDPYGGLGPYYIYGVADVVGWLLAQPAVADISVTAEYADVGQTQVDVDVATTFRFSAESSAFRLMLVLTADSLEGDGNDWLQVNTLVGRTEYDAACDEFVNGERYMRLKYNHVPVFVDGVENGIEGSISAPLRADEAQHYTRRIDLSKNNLVQRKECVSAVALLIDTQSGHVVNAAKAHLGGATDGIASHEIHDRETYRSYDLRGLRVTTPKAGVIIQRLNNGETRKIIR